MKHVISTQSLFVFIESALLATGFTKKNAEITADLMVQADISGQDGHGIFRLPQYIKRLQEGGMNPKPKFKILSQRTATALIDGDNGIGHLVMRHAADIAIKKAPDRIQLLKAIYDEEFDRAQAEDRDRASFNVTPSLQYYRVG